MHFSWVELTLMSAILTNLWIDTEGHSAHGCRGGQVTLSCSSGSVLISEVILADSSCLRSSCCPHPNDCRGAPSDVYRNSVLRSCNGKASCVVDVEIRKIGCSIFPNNDYVSISYECQEAETTSTTLRLRPTPFPAAATTEETLLRSASTHNTEAATMGVPTGSKTMNGKDEGEGEEEKKRRGITTSVPDQLEEKVTTSPALKPVVVFHQMTKLPHAENEALKQGYKEDSQQPGPDRMITMTSLIVGCIVIVTTVIAAAVVMALKKRRLPKSTTDQALVTTNVLCASEPVGGGGEGRGGDGGEGGEENCRSSNIYELIPDIRMGGEGGGGDGDALKENEYLRPMMDDEDRPYLWIP